MSIQSLIFGDTFSSCSLCIVTLIIFVIENSIIHLPVGSIKREDITPQSMFYCCFQMMLLKKV